MSATDSIQPTRFVGIDLHKHYVVIGAVDAQQHIVLPPCRLSLSELSAWQTKHLQKSDAVVLEATANAWILYDQLMPQVASVTVAHPLMVKLITAARVKTDANDTIKLARLLAGGLIPAIWVPPAHVRELRGLVAHRRRLINWRTQARNRLHSVLHRHNLIPPEQGVFALAQRQWWKALAIPPSERLRAQHDLQLLDQLEPLIDEVEAELCRLSTTEPWTTQVPFLVQLPGIGVLSAMILLSAIGDIGRFACAKQLVGYSGLGASVHASGQTHRTGSITKQGRREIRAIMVEIAWVAVEHSAHWKQIFQRLELRIGRQKAIVAVARKMLVVIWHVLSDSQIDQHGEVESIARKFMTWGTQQRTATRQGLSRPVFVRQKLDNLGVGPELHTFKYGGTVINLPAPTVRESVES